MKRVKRGLLCAMGILLLMLCFTAHSLAEDEFRARDGNGWSLTADGVLTIENNAGWQDYLKNGACEVINELIIGKELTEFSLGTCFIYRPDEFIFLGTPPENFPEYIEDEFYKVAPQVYYTEPFADAWKPIAANGLNGWPTQCISVEEANNRIAQAAVPTPEPTRTPETTTEVLGMHISTPEPYTPPDQPTEDTKTDPLVYVFAGLLVLVAAGIVVIGVRKRKKQHGKPNRKG